MTSPAPSARAVLFDLFGTLVPVDPPERWEKQIERMAAAVGMPADVFGREFLNESDDRMTGALDIAGNVRQVCSRAGVEPTDEQVAAAVAARAMTLHRWLRPRDATVPALRRLRAAGLPLAVVSDCSSDTVTLWPDTPFAPYFDATVFSCTMGTRKPDPRMYLTACDALGVRPEDCLFVGDGNSNELTGATALGIRAVHIDAERPEHPVAEYEGASWTGERIHSLAEVPVLLGL